MLARSRRSVVVVDSGTLRNAPAKGVYGLLGLDGTLPPELLRTGREEARRYGGLVVAGQVVSASPGAASAAGDLRSTVMAADGRILSASGGHRSARRASRHPRARCASGRAVVHCPYCHDV